MSIEVPRETTEFVRVEVLVDDQVPSSGVEFAVLPEGTRPLTADWVAGQLLNGGTVWATLLTAPTVGTYDVWVRVTDTPEVAVIRLRGQVRVV